MTHRHFHLLLWLCLLAPLLTAAQPADRATQIRSTGLAYGHLGIGLGVPHAVRLGADFILAGHHQLSIGYTGTTRKSPGVPQDAVKLDGLLQVFDNPQETMNALTLGYGYVIYPGSAGPSRKRVVLRASALIGARNDLSNVRPYATSPVTYSYERSWTKTVGLLVEPQLELAAGRGFGMSAGPYAIATDHMFGAGLSVSMLFGYVSNYRRPVSAESRSRHEFRRSHPFRRYPRNLK